MLDFQVFETLNVSYYAAEPHHEIVTDEKQAGTAETRDPKENVDVDANVVCPHRRAHCALIAYRWGASSSRLERETSRRFCCSRCAEPSSGPTKVLGR